MGSRPFPLRTYHGLSLSQRSKHFSGFLQVPYSHDQAFSFTKAITSTRTPLDKQTTSRVSIERPNRQKEALEEQNRNEQRSWRHLGNTSRQITYSGGARLARSTAWPIGLELPRVGRGQEHNTGVLGLGYSRQRQLWYWSSGRAVLQRCLARIRVSGAT